MPKVTMFEDQGDEFVVRDGALIWLGRENEFGRADETVVTSANLSEFADWINTEVALLDAKKAAADHD